MFKLLILEKDGKERILSLLYRKPLFEKCFFWAALTVNKSLTAGLDIEIFIFEIKIANSDIWCN